MLNKIRSAVLHFRKDDSGATIVEYAVALTIVVVVGVLITQVLGGQVEQVFIGARDAFTAGGFAPP